MAERKATIIYNPMSGRAGKRAEEAAEMARLLKERGIATEAKATTAPDDATRLAGEAIAKGSNIIISYGGDGTLNEVIQAMVGSDAVLGVWAGGTANVVARDLNLPRSTKCLAEVIAAGKTKRIALGVASSSPLSVARSPLSVDKSNESASIFEMRSADVESGVLQVEQRAVQYGLQTQNDELRTTDYGLRTKRYFFMFAGVGLDASIARGVNRKLKRKTGEFAFWVSGIKHLLMWGGDPFTVEVDGRKYESAFTLVGNGKSYGGNLEMAKNARLEDPEFEVFMMPRYKFNVAYLFALVKCFFKKPEKTGAKIVKGNRVTMYSDKEIWVELDGELVGTLPMTFEVLPDALSVIVL
jgi:diacylglycerol kinase family enzyme